MARMARLRFMKLPELLNVANRFSPSIYDTHGWVLVLAGKADEGVIVLRKLVDQAPSAESYYHLAEGYIRQGKTDLASTQLQSAKQLIDDMDRAKQPVDARLKTAIESAIQKVDGKNPS